MPSLFFRNGQMREVPPTYNTPLIRQCIIALRIQKINAAFLSMGHVYIATKPNSSQRRPIKGNSVCIQVKHVWISWCITTCVLISVLNFCIILACIFPPFLLSTLAFIQICSAFHTLWCAMDILPKRFGRRTL